MKKAIALITYYRDEYFSKVLESIVSQKINGKSLVDFYDFYIFQDGLDNPNDEMTLFHASISKRAKQCGLVKQFYQQDKNLGVAKHFDWVERLLFQEKAYDFVVFCEDDMILGDAYMATLDAMAEHFQHENRVAMISAHSTTYAMPLEKQAAKANEYLPMGHSWGFGLYRKAWEEIRPMLEIYLDLLRGVPYRQRNHLAIRLWLQNCGFKLRDTSQDYIKACCLTALGYLRLSSYPNYAFYIGEKGEHFNPVAYAEGNYSGTHIFNEPAESFSSLSDSKYQALWEFAAKQCLNDGIEFDKPFFSHRLSNGSLIPDIPSNVFSNLITPEDVVAAYKIFFGRVPENPAVIEAWVGKSPGQLFASLIHSSELKKHLNGSD